MDDMKPLPEVETMPTPKRRGRAPRIPDAPLPVPLSVTFDTASTSSATTSGQGPRKISVLEKRLSGGNPFGVESVAIPLKDPGWTTYIANGGRSDGRLYEMKAAKGWEPVRVTDVAVPPEQLGFKASPEGYLCRGEKGQEVVFKMRTADYQRLQAAKTAKNLQTIGSSAKTKAAIANAAGTQFGDEAGQFVHDHFVGEIRDWRAPEDLP